MKQGITDNLNKCNNLEEISKRTMEDTKLTSKKVEAVSQERKELEKEKEELAYQLAMLQMVQRERMLRIRGIPESTTQNLLDVLTNELAKLLQVDISNIEGLVEDAYRVNNTFAVSQKVSRDCIIQLNSKST